MMNQGRIVIVMLLQRLYETVSGESVSAPTGLAVCSEAYFTAVAKMGEQALHTFTSRSLGKKSHLPVCQFQPQLSKVLHYHA